MPNYLDMKIEPVRFTIEELEEKLFDLRETWEREPEVRESYYKAIFMNLTASCKGLDTEQILNPSYKPPIENILARAYIKNIQNIGRIYSNSAWGMLLKANEMEFDWRFLELNKKTEERARLDFKEKINDKAAVYYEDLKDLTKFPPLIETLENIISLDRSQIGLLEKMDNRRNEIIQQANLLFIPSSRRW